MRSCRPLRADAARNRARVLEVAYEAFAAEGLSVPVDEIARRAGVGAGTVYRHFPTKTALFEAIIRQRVDRLVQHAHRLAETADPADGFFTFFAELVEEGAADRGLTDALAGEGVDVDVMVPGIETAFKNALGELLGRAQRAGAVRHDVDVVDVKAVLVACQAMQRYRGDGDATRHLVDVVLDGLRSKP